MALLIVAKLQEGNDSNKIYDAEKKNFVDAFKSGIIDPTKVVRTALQSAGSVAGLLLTTEAVIADKASEGDNDNASSGGQCLQVLWVACQVWAAWVVWAVSNHLALETPSKGSSHLGLYQISD
jgi:hypothetical protein